MKVKLPITKFFSDVLNAPLQNHVWSWGSETDQAVFLRVWDDEVRDDGRVVLIKEANDSESSRWESEQRLGWKERKRHLKAAASGKAVYGVLLRHKVDKEGNPLHGAGCIAWYDDKAVYPLNDIVIEGGETTAQLDKSMAKQINALEFDSESVMLEIVSKATPKGVETINKALKLGWTLVNYFGSTAVFTLRGRAMNVDIETGLFER